MSSLVELSAVRSVRSLVGVWTYFHCNYHTIMRETSIKTRNKKIAANYRVKEPIKNLKLRVRIVQQRPLLAELENEQDARDSSFLEEENLVFDWQEKVFSRFEANFYRDENNCSTEQQKTYHCRVKENDIQGGQLYTYTETDSYYPKNDSLLTEPGRKTRLSVKNRTALPRLQNRKPFTDRYNKTVVDDRPDETRIRMNHYLPMERFTMRVMVDLSRRDETTKDDDSEILLCTISYDESRKILSVDPDFTNDHCCYTIANSSGVRFHYWIEHASEKQSSLELQQQRNESRREMKERLMYKEAEIFHGIELNSPNMHTFFLKMDIILADGFSFNGLFVSYYIHLPEHWTTNDNDKLFGRTQRCNLTNKCADFGYATEISLNFPSINILDAKKIVPSWPILLFSVASLDSWSRYRMEGYASMSLPVLPGLYEFKLPTWRPGGGIVNRLRRFFTGGTYELENITYCGIPTEHEGRALNKSQLKVTQSGYLKIKMNTIHQTHNSIKNNNLFDLEKLSTVNLMTNIENIFEQFKAARERMIKIRNLNI